MHQKLVPDPLLIVRYFESGLSQKPFKKSTLLFLPNPALFNGQRYKKQKGPGTSDHLLFRLQNKLRKIPSLYYLTKFDDVI